MMQDCIFCKISQGEIKTDAVYQDEKVIAFKDTHPQAPHHILIIPHQHIATINDISERDSPLLGHMFQIAKHLAIQLKIEEKGYRLLFNCNREGGQAVYHIHLHLLGGRQMAWPPG